MILKNRNRHGGGVLLYVKRGIRYTEINDTTSPQVESIWIKLAQKKESLALGIIYRPPSSKVDYFNDIIDQIDQIYSGADKV